MIYPGCHRHFMSGFPVSVIKFGLGLRPKDKCSAAREKKPMAPRVYMIQIKKKKKKQSEAVSRAPFTAEAGKLLDKNSQSEMHVERRFGSPKLIAMRV